MPERPAPQRAACRTMRVPTVAQAASDIAGSSEGRLGPFPRSQPATVCWCHVGSHVGVQAYTISVCSAVAVFWNGTKDHEVDTARVGYGTRVP